MTQRQAILDAFLKLLVEKGWQGFALRDVADAAGTGLAELYADFPSRQALIEAFTADVDRQVLAGTAPSLDPDETVRDRLFDAFMRRYDALRPHRQAIAALAEGLARDPVAALAMSRAVGRAMGAMLEAAGVSAEGWRGALRRNALAAMHIAVLRVWLNDDTADQSKTMSALDHRLKRAERWAQAIDRIGKSSTRRRQAEDRPATPPEPMGEALADS